jgi:hypothetical protein
VIMAMVMAMMMITMVMVLAMVITVLDSDVNRPVGRPGTVGRPRFPRDGRDGAKAVRPVLTTSCIRPRPLTRGVGTPSAHT